MVYNTFANIHFIFVSRYSLNISWIPLYRSSKFVEWIPAGIQPLVIDMLSSLKRNAFGLLI